MTDDTHKKTPARAVSNESGYISMPTTPGMLHVSTDFRGICKKKVTENFGYLKIQIPPEIVLEEIQASGEVRISEQKVAELRYERSPLVKADCVIKFIIRRGEGSCKCFLKCLQGESIGQSFILEELHNLQDKSIPPKYNYNIDIKDIQNHFAFLSEELEITDILDPLFENYVITIDNHDEIEYNQKTRLAKNSTLITVLLKKESDAWILGFIHVLEINECSPILQQIQHQGHRVFDYSVPQIFNQTYRMSIKVNGVNARSIELQLARSNEIDALCREFAKLEISDVRHGSVLLMVHPITPDWGKSSNEEKHAILKDFFQEILSKPDVKDLIQREISVTIEINESKNVFGDPEWRVKRTTNLSAEQQRLHDHWTFLVEELEVNSLIEYFTETKRILSAEDKRRINGSGSRERRERTHEFLLIFLDKIDELKLEILIKALEDTRQKRVADRLKKETTCIDCLLETYKDPENYKIILDELVSSIMKRTVEKFGDKVPHHIQHIITPACGKPRRQRADLFMHYVLLNDEVLRSFENTLATIDFVPLTLKFCDVHTSGATPVDFSLSNISIEDTDLVHCTFNVKKERDRSLTISLETIPQRLQNVPESPEEIPRKKSGLQSVPSVPYMRETQDLTSMVVAIDFGTTYSGFAFSTKQKDAKIFTKQWGKGDKGLESSKTPTSILFYPDNTFHSFGYEAEKNYEHLSADRGHERYYFFKHFKMKLHTAKELRRNAVIEDVIGNTMTAAKIFSESIKYLKHEAEKMMMEQGYKVREDCVSWIITVPAIWNDASKQFMREAAEMASISANRLKIALEPEVASVYIGAQSLEKMPASKTASASLVKSAPKSRFMVVDVGGGTADITIMEVAADFTFNQMSIASGGPCGGETINYKIIEFLSTVIDRDVMNAFRMDLTYDYNELLTEIEFTKRNWKIGQKLRMNLPQSLIELFQQLNGEHLSERLKRKTKVGVTLKNNKLSLGAELAEDIFVTVIGEVTKQSKAAFSKLEKISYIVLVGGFADCDLLKREFRKEFEGTNVIIPEDAGLAVLKGAVLYGHDPTCISMRHCDRTYGILVYRPFMKGDPVGKKTMKEGTECCKDAFHILASVGECLDLNETRSAEMEPIRRDMTSMTVKLYGSTDPNPKYVTEPSCSELGRITVDIPEEWRRLNEIVTISMTFGETEILVEGKTLHGDKVSTATIDFLSQGDS